MQAAGWGDGTMGSKFLKAVFREFTDEEFTTQAKQANPSDGMAGPTLRGEVGDVITVVFMVSTKRLPFGVDIRIQTLLLACCVI